MAVRFGTNAMAELAVCLGDGGLKQAEKRYLNSKAFRISLISLYCMPRAGFIVWFNELEKFSRA